MKKIKIGSALAALLILAAIATQTWLAWACLGAVALVVYVYLDRDWIGWRLVLLKRRFFRRMH